MKAELIYFALFDLGMAVAFLLIGLLFIKSKGRAARYILGRRGYRPEESRRLDEDFCRRYGRRIMSWPFLFLLGLAVDLVWPGAGSTAAFLLFLVVLICHVKRMEKG